MGMEPIRVTHQRRGWKVAAGVAAAILLVLGLLGPYGLSLPEILLGLGVVLGLGLALSRKRNEDLIVTRDEIIWQKGGGLTVIAMDDLTEIRRTNPKLEAELIGKDGKVIPVQRGASGWLLAADEIAMRAGWNVQLNPPMVPRKPPTTSSSLVMAWAFFFGGLTPLLAITFFVHTAPWLSLVQLLLGAICISGLILAQRAWLLSRRPDLYDPDAIVPPKPMLAESYAKARRYEIKPVELQTGKTYVYLRQANQFKSALALVGLVPLCFGLGWTGILLFRTLGEFLLIQQFAWHLLLNAIPGLLLAHLGWHMTRWGLLTLGLNSQSIEVTEDELIVHRAGMFFRRPMHIPRNQKPRERTSPFFRGLFGRWEVYRSTDGWLVRIDRRFLWEADRPMYEPESPWEDLWRGRVLPKGLPD